MEEVKQIVEEQVESLEMEVKKFANQLDYYAKFLADKILSGNVITTDDINSSYSYLLEQLKLAPESAKVDININYNNTNKGRYKDNLMFTKLENVEGVNALIENQSIEFNPNLTIIYGANGSGKSSYVRLLKKAFYSKAPEDILHNIRLDSGHKSINAKLTFKSPDSEISLIYPTNENNSEFEQFSVFDGKSVLRHLDQKNEFEFRPAGLSFFSEYTEAIKAVEQKVASEISNKQSDNIYIDLFDGDSEIKTIIQTLSAQTKLEDLKRHLPFSEEDKIERTKIQKEYDELLLVSKGKEKGLQALDQIKKLLDENRKKLEILNKYFSKESFDKIKSAINDHLNKEKIAKTEGIESFSTDMIKGIGSSEWKNFILASQVFANTQNLENKLYPQNGDNCLLCHQPLSEEAQTLITNYWSFIRSIAEEDSKKAIEVLNKIEDSFEKLNFDLFPNENVFSVWMTEKHPSVLVKLKQTLSKQKTLAETIILNIKSRETKEWDEIELSVIDLNLIESDIDASIKMLKEDEQSKELEKWVREITKLHHKEKLNMHYSKLEMYVNNQAWIKGVGKANFGKRKITDTEKSLSDKYFNQKYIDKFNEECKNLNGNFGIEINHTGSAGKSFRQLKLKGRNPNAVLSEGEQKVIAIADFISEMYLSDINRGVIFDDPVTSLDEMRKSEIAYRLVKESKQKQVIIFTHDLVFVSSLIGHCKDLSITNDCHWIEKLNENQPGTIWLRNTPSFEKDYKTSGKAQDYYKEAKSAAPELREQKIKNGFAALRTSYETQVVFGLFEGVVQRFEERVSVDSLKKVFFNTEIRDELTDNFYQCCRYMEGHSYSDKYAYKKPQLENLNEEIQRFNTIKKKISDLKKSNNNNKE